jgi:hypothetical protein
MVISVMNFIKLEMATLIRYVAKVSGVGARIEKESPTKERLNERTKEVRKPAAARTSNMNVSLSLSLSLSVLVVEVHGGSPS